MFALDLATEGRYVAVVSSGDPGIYAMAIGDRTNGSF